MFISAYGIRRVGAPSHHVFALDTGANGGWEYPAFLVVLAVAVALQDAGRCVVRAPAASPAAVRAEAARA
jgi:hypothetical protein